MALDDLLKREKASSDTPFYYDGYHDDDATYPGTSDPVGSIDHIIAEEGGKDYTPDKPIRGLNIDTGGTLLVKLAGGSDDLLKLASGEKYRGDIITTIYQLSGGEGEAEGIHPRF